MCDKYYLVVQSLDVLFDRVDELCLVFLDGTTNLRNDCQYVRSD